MKQLKNIRNNIKEILWLFFRVLPYFRFLFLFMFIISDFVNYRLENQVKDLQDQLTIQQSHTNRWKMEAERNGIALQQCAITNKENQRKLEEIKLILEFNY